MPTDWAAEAALAAEEAEGIEGVLDLIAACYSRLEQHIDPTEFPSAKAMFAFNNALLYFRAMQAFWRKEVRI